MRSFTEQFTAYQQEHTQQTNKLLHYISVPALLIGILLALSWLSISIVARWHITFAWIAIVALLIYYYFLHIRLAIAMTVVLIIVTLICSWIAFPAPTGFSLILFLILFVGGAILEFVDLSLEKSSATFFSRLGPLVITPLFLLTEGIIALKFEKYFDLEVPSHQPTEE